MVKPVEFLTHGLKIRFAYGKQNRARFVFLDQKAWPNQNMLFLVLFNVFLGCFKNCPFRLGKRN